MFFFHADEPLRRRAKNYRRPMAPAVRIAVRDFFRRQQHAAIAEQIDDGRVCFPDVLAAEDFRVWQIDTVRSNWIENLQSVALADDKIICTVTRRGMYGASAFFGGHVIPENDRNKAIVERMTQFLVFEFTSRNHRRRCDRQIAIRRTREFSVSSGDLRCEIGSDYEIEPMLAARWPLDERIFQIGCRARRPYSPATSMAWSSRSERRRYRRPST